MNRKRIKLNFFSSRVITIIGILIIIYAAYGLAKITWQNYQVNQRISSLEENLKKIDEDNFELSNKIAYYKTNAYKERQAREKLNLQKPGEVVIVIPNTPQPEDKKGQSQKETKPQKSKPENWRDYFFSNKKGAT
jgi:cell division protein FtsB